MNTLLMIILIIFGIIAGLGLLLLLVRYLFFPDGLFSGGAVKDEGLNEQYEECRILIPIRAEEEENQDYFENEWRSENNKPIYDAGIPKDNDLPNPGGHDSDEEFFETTDTEAAEEKEEFESEQTYIDIPRIQAKPGENFKSPKASGVLPTDDERISENRSDVTINVPGLEFDREDDRNKMDDLASMGSDYMRGNWTMAMPPKPPENVFLGAAAPGAAQPGEEFTARFFAYLEEHETQIRETLRRVSSRSNFYERVKNCQWQRDTKVKVSLSGKNLSVANPVEEFYWRGESVEIEFDVEVSPDAEPGASVVLKYDVSISDIVIAKLRIDLAIGEQSAGADKFHKFEPARRAFASYASSDRSRVLDRISEIRRNGVDVFLDCLSINPGEAWKPRLEREIRDRELFLLFWSANAKKSEWVKWEWQTALQQKGLSGIDPHPLDPVYEAEPPAELSELHFGDPYNLIREAYENAPPKDE